MNIPTFDDREVQERQIEESAKAVRMALDLGSAPIPDMAVLLESLGVRIIMLPPEKLNLMVLQPGLQVSPA